MDRLVEQCLQYMKRHIDDTIRMPIDFDCLNDKIVSRLTALFTDRSVLRFDHRSPVTLSFTVQRSGEDNRQEGQIGFKTVLFFGSLSIPYTRGLISCFVADI